MIQGKKVACVIPARLASTRFPEKILRNLAGKPLLQWIYEKAIRYPIFDHVAFAIDDERTAKVIERFSGKWVMTDPALSSGTARLCAYRLQTEISSDFWLNWQADEPLISFSMLDTLFQSIDADSDIWTLMKKISLTEAQNPDCVKVVLNHQDQALYFSRSVIPYPRDEKEVKNFFQHVGLYLYSDRALSRITQIIPSSLEKIEKLEQLTFLHHGMKIKLALTDQEAIGIDRPEDLIEAEKLIFDQIKMGLV